MIRCSRCSHCGKEGAARRCSVCKQASYCGAECQNAAWKKHKKTCEPPLSRDDIIGKISAARATKHWVGIVKWKGRLDELLEGQPDAACDSILSVFVEAHTMMDSESDGISAIRLLERRVDLLGKMGRFRDQGRRICDLAERLHLLGRAEEAAKLFERAQAVGAAHGFVSVECRSCEGIELRAVREGGDEEGVDLLQNALTALPPVEGEESMPEDEGSLFSTSADKELRKAIQHLTKKNTKVTSLPLPTVD